jgi:hypothetical protein
MTNKAALLRITCYLAAASLLLIFCNPLASLAFHRPTPEPAPAAAGGQPTFRLDAGLTPAESGAPVYDTLTVDQRRAENLPTALPAALPYYGSRTVYLTFDDGPDPDVTPAILAILSQAGVRATFFVVGSQAEKSPATLRQSTPPATPSAITLTITSTATSTARRPPTPPSSAAPTTSS